jgi:acetoin utilization protein AcuC
MDAGNVPRKAMVGGAALIYHDDYMLYQFGPRHPFQPVREKLTLDTLSSLRLLDGCGGRVVVPDQVERDTLHLVHPPEFVAEVERICLADGLLDLGDTPGNPGLFTGALSAVGGTVRGACGIMNGEFTHAFNPGGGLHHAHPTRSLGFCVFNDIAVAVRWLQKEHHLTRIAVVDIDGHHGDGTQSIFYREPVLTVSLHRYGQRFYPGTGGVGERGEGSGEGFNINVPLPAGTGDRPYLHAYRSIVVPALRAYRPEMIIGQFGADAHYLDPLVGLGLTTATYEEVARTTHELAHQMSEGRYLVVGGGGYHLDATRRAWSMMFAVLAGHDKDPGVAALRDAPARDVDEGITAEAERIIDQQAGTALPLLDWAMERI